VGDEEIASGSRFTESVVAIKCGTEVGHRKKLPLGRCCWSKMPEGKVIGSFDRVWPGEVRREKGTPHLICIARIRREESSKSPSSFSDWRYYLRREG